MGQSQHASTQLSAGPLRCSKLLLFTLYTVWPWIFLEPHGVTLWLCFCGCFPPYGVWGGRGHAEAHQSDAFRARKWCLCRRVWGRAQEFVGAKAAEVVQDGCVGWREPNLGLRCPFCLFSAKSGVQYPCEVTVALLQEKIMN